MICNRWKNSSLRRSRRSPPHYDTFAEFHYSYHYGDSYIPHIQQEGAPEGGVSALHRLHRKWNGTDNQWPFRLGTGHHSGSGDRFAQSQWRAGELPAQARRRHRPAALEAKSREPFRSGLWPYERTPRGPTQLIAPDVKAWTRCAHLWFCQSLWL